MARIPTPWFRKNATPGSSPWTASDTTSASIPQVLSAPQDEGQVDAPSSCKVPRADGRARRRPAAQAPASDRLTVAELFDKFLDWCQKHRADAPTTVPRPHPGFLDACPALAACRRPLCGRSTSSSGRTSTRPGATPAVGGASCRSSGRSTGRRNSATSTATRSQRSRSPPCQRREQAVTPEEWVKIRDRYADGDPFRDLLEFCWETGAAPGGPGHRGASRPSLTALCVVFPPDEAKGKKRCADHPPDAAGRRHSLKRRLSGSDEGRCSVTRRQALDALRHELPVRPAQEAPGRQVCSPTPSGTASPPANW